MVTKIDKEFSEKETSLLIDKVISNYDDGELFVEEIVSENLLFDDNKIKSANYDEDKGFGLRVIKGDSVGFAHSSELTKKALHRALKSVKNLEKGKNLNSNKILKVNIIFLY